MGGFGSGHGSGGAREGAGRHRTGRAASKTVSVKITPQEHTFLSKRAEAAGLSINAFFRMWALGSETEIQKIMQYFEKSG